MSRRCAKDPNVEWASKIGRPRRLATRSNRSKNIPRNAPCISADQMQSRQQCEKSSPSCFISQSRPGRHVICEMKQDGQFRRLCGEAQGWLLEISGRSQPIDHLCTAFLGGTSTRAWILPPRAQHQPLQSQLSGSDQRYI